MAVSWKDNWKEDLAALFPKLVIGGLWLIGAFYLFIGYQFLPMRFRWHDMEDVMEHGVRKGIFVAGEVPYSFDCFAELSDRNDGTISSYYYAIPTDDNVFILQVSRPKNSAMETLLEETYDYLSTGILPVSTVYVEGFVTEAPGRLPYLLTEYLKEIGYTQEEIDAMGVPLLLHDEVSRMQRIRVWWPLGFILVMAGIVVFVPYILFRKRRNAWGQIIDE